MKGKLITVEGADGCGKTTHVKLLADWLRSEGHDVLVTDEPTDNPIGKVLKSSLRRELELPVEAEALLFAADRVKHVAEVIRPALDAGKVVIAERYVYSSLAYQSVRGLPMEWIRAINERAPEPDFAVVIDVPVEVAFERIKRSRKLDTFEEDLELQRRVRERYLEIAEAEGLAVVDGRAKIDEVQAKIRERVAAHLKD